MAKRRKLAKRGTKLLNKLGKVVDQLTTSKRKRKNKRK
jgi:hypothetical protein